MVKMVHFSYTLFTVLMLFRTTSGQHSPIDDPNAGSCDKYMTCSGQYEDYHSDSFTWTGKSFENTLCYCDPYCYFYNDCCVDAKTFSNNLPVIELENMECYYSEAFMQAIYQVRSCPQENKNIPFYLKNKCEGYQALEKINGSEILQHVPVSHKQTGVTFKNIFCAICNGIDPYKETTFWKARIECYKSQASHSLYSIHSGSQSRRNSYQNNRQGGLRSKEGINQTMIEEVQHVDEACQLSIETNPPPEARPQRECVSDIEDKCPDSYQNEIVKQKCNEFKALVGSEENPWRIFRNHYCALCNNVTSVGCKYIRPKLNTQMKPMPQFVPSYQMLLDFNSGSGKLLIDGKVTKHHTRHPECGAGYLYDPSVSKCMYLFCPRGTLFINETCVSESSTYSANNVSEIQCPQVRFNNTDFTILDNDSVYLNSSGIILNISDYTLSDDGYYISVCYKFLEEKYSNLSIWRNTNDSVQRTLTFIGLILSLLSLLILIIIYSAFKKLQNTPGKSILALSASLFLGQTLFLFNSVPADKKGACIFVAILMHYCFLAAFFWMNVLAFDVWRTFNKQYMLMSTDQGSKKFGKYCIYAFGCPLLIIIVCMSLDFTNENISIQYKPQYGVDVCWIRNTYALIGAFALPLAIIVVVNFIFFAMAVYYINDAVQSTRVVQEKKSKKKSLLLYFKLSTIVGLTWMFGFIANFVKSTQVFWYLFIIFNSLQGLFICIGFVCTKTVCNLMRTAGKSLSSRYATSSSDSSHKRRTLTSSV